MRRVIISDTPPLFLLDTIDLPSSLAPQLIISRNLPLPWPLSPLSVEPSPFLGPSAHYK